MKVHQIDGCVLLNTVPVLSHFQDRIIFATFDIETTEEYISLYSSLMKIKESSVLSKTEYDFLITVLSFQILDMQASLMCAKVIMTL